MAIHDNPAIVRKADFDDPSRFLFVIPIDVAIVQQAGQYLFNPAELSIRQHQEIPFFHAASVL